MTERYGAAPGEWDNFSLILGLTEDLLPVVSNPNATISPQSKMKALGKTPSRYNRVREVAGVANWTSHKATPTEITRWRQEPDYGICLQTRTVRALDCDINNDFLAKDIYNEINKTLHPLLLPLRRRDGASKFLLAFSLPGEYAKRTIRTDDGIIEFLATGQQFVACGTHPSGARYEWVGGLPDEIPELQPDVFEKLWSRLVECFAVDGSETRAAGVSKQTKLTEATSNDPVAQSLLDKGIALSTERDGRIHLVCPFSAEHTSDSAESATTYFPAFTGGFERGHFACLHAHCAERTDAEFLSALGLDHVEISADFDAIPDGATTQSAGEGRYVFEPWQSFIAGAAPRYLVKDVLPAAALTVIYGEPTSGKTFFALDLACAVARGGAWRNKRVAQGAALYVAAEDVNGVRHRIKAYISKHALTDMPLYVLGASPNFMKLEDVKDVLAAAKPLNPSVIFVDTWAQVTPGANENSGEDMGRAMGFCRSLHLATGALMVLIHHSGKDASKGARGWSGLRGAADAEIEITRTDDDRTARISKMKNGRDGDEYGFRLDTVLIGQDEDGDDVTSCVLEHTQAKPKAERGRREPKGAIEKLVMKALSDLLIGGPVPTSDVIDASVCQMPFDSAAGKRDKRREHVLRALNGLVERGLLVVDDGKVSVAGAE